MFYKDIFCILILSICAGLLGCKTTFQDDGITRDKLTRDGLVRDGNTIKVAEICVRRCLDNSAHRVSNKGTRMVPSFNQGKSIGFKVFVSSNSILDYFGVQTGDILVSIAGFTLDKEEDVLNIYKLLNREKLPKYINIELLRERNIIILKVIFVSIPSECLLNVDSFV